MNKILKISKTSIGRSRSREIVAPRSPPLIVPSREITFFANEVLLDEDHEPPVTSEIPLKIIEIKELSTNGRYSVIEAPGKWMEGESGNQWHRDLKKDLNWLVSKDINLIVSLLNENEYPICYAGQTSESILSIYKSCSLHCYRIDLELNNGLPSDPNLSDVIRPVSSNLLPSKLLFSECIETLHRFLQEGKHIAIHGLNGFGRTGLITAGLLIRSGRPASEAIEITKSYNSWTLSSADLQAYLAEYADLHSPLLAPLPRTGSFF